MIPLHIKDNLYGPDNAENISFEEVLAQNEKKILNLIYGMTGDYHLAQDLTQDTFVKAFQAKETFNGKSKISTWLYRIGVNVTIDYQRKSSVRKESPSEDIETDGICHSNGGSADPDKACQKNAIRDIMFNAIASLPEQQKEVLVLREINGCSNKEIAEILGCTLELVKWRLHKARSGLRKILQANNKYKDLGTYKLNGFGLE